MDKKIANNVIVGVVVAIGFLGFLFVVFNIGGGTGLFARQHTLYAKFPHVKGLHFGSEVSLAGLRVGVVRNIVIATDSSKELTVELSVGKEHFDKIRQDSVASINTQGVLGDKYVEISIGSPELPQVKPGDTLPSTQAPDLFTKGGDLVEEVKRVFDKGSDFEGMLKNLNVVAANLAVITTDLRNQKGLYHELVYGPSGSHVKNATMHLSGIMKKIDQGEGSLGALINDPTVYEDLKSLLGGAKRSSILRYFMRSFIESGQDDKGGAKERGE